MADDWQAGDTAVCVRGRGPLNGTARAADQCSPIKSALFPAVGSKWQVNAVEIHSSPEWEDGQEAVYLNLAGQPSDIAFDARCFRKIRPLTNEERDEFIADLRTPVREPVA
jgi:hypothetical protein